MQIEFQVFRQLPPAPPHMQSFWLEISPSSTILEALTRLKWEQDGSLAFRKNCRNTICGSCAMRINGRAALACQRHISEEQQGSQPIVIAPLGNLPIMKDLIVDMQNFWQDLERVDPYVSTATRKIPEREFLQSPQERQQIGQAANCILCGACYSDCNAKEVNPAFVGPHALAKVNRLIGDSRDDQTAQRLAQQNSLAGVWGCTRCLNCDHVCPMGVAPLDQITQIKQTLLAQTPDTPAASRAIRHRKTLVTLVQAGGWIDERQFGLTVVGNRGRDPLGLLSLAPLGLRMLRKGKFPLHFKASLGSATVKKLIQRIRAQTPSDPKNLLGRVDL
ncbi:MAG: succinate dehydrogenase/fumarate reductase iron-sulfur subunit [Cyanobacteriota bacterium]|nr:succinate dehydrogenase/fumarate reductase iron-sulfur subunit [Cyanobacteriota bacterium]